MRKTLTFLFLAGFGLSCLALDGQRRVAAQSEARNESAIDTSIDKNARQVLHKGRQIFRFDTFGDEAFWGDTLKLHQAFPPAL